MSKLIKVIILIFLLISVGFSLLIYFDILPLSKKLSLKEQKETAQITPEITKLPVSRSPFPCVILDDEYCPLGELVYDGEELVCLFSFF